MIFIRNISKSILNKLLFSEVSLTIQNRDRIGIVGPNGSGKSTFLKLLAGLDFADDGEIELEKTRVGFLEQQFPEEDLTKTIAQYLKNFKAHEVDKILTELNFVHSSQVTVATLSGGEKTKLALAKILLERPNALVLDEPTNHLDAETSEWLASFLHTWHGSLVCVSHDRAFLNHTINQIWEFDPVRHEVHVHKGNYDDFLESKKLQDKKWQEEYKEQRRELQRMEDFIKEKQRQSHISDDPAIGRQIRQMERRIQKQILDQEIVRPTSTLHLPKQQIKGEGHSGKLICRLLNVHFSAGTKVLFSGPSGEIRGQDRVHLKGANGSGKSTLVKMILGEIAPASGEARLGENLIVGYLDQHHTSLPLEKSLLEFAHSLPHSGDDRAFLAKYGFTGISVNKQLSALSQGEQVRLMFARLMLENFDLLILDEPTNHLDIESREIIEQTLTEFKGALLVISHDQYFVEQIGITKEWRIENKTIKERLV